MVVKNLTALSLALFASVSAVADERPTRSECIIGYALDWTGVKTDRYDVIEDMSYWMLKHGRPGQLAGTSVGSDASRLYLQYRSSCEKKQQMATKLIGFWRSQNLELPAFERLPDPIAPSTDTIDLKGPDWRDPGTPLFERREKSSDSI